MKALSNISLKSYRKIGVIIGGVAIALSVTAIALAAIPDAGGVIHGCYSKLGGALRVIDSPGASCNFTENSLNWNQQSASTSVPAQISNKISVAKDAPSQVYLTIPSLGEYATSCVSNGSNTRVTSTFKNTSSRTLVTNTQEVTPGTTVTIGGFDAGTYKVIDDYITTENDGQAQHLVRTSIQAFTIPDPSTCLYIGSATIFS